MTKKQDVDKTDSPALDKRIGRQIMKKAAADKAAVTAAGQTGPAAGVDPMVRQPPLETSRETDIMVEQDSHTGPVQEPVHRQAEPVSPQDDPDAKTEDAPKRATKVSADKAEELVAAIRRVHEGMGVASVTDDGGRVWDLRYQTVGNQAAVVMQLQRGDASHTHMIASSAMGVEGDDHLHDAVHEAAKGADSKGVK